VFEFSGDSDKMAEERLVGVEEVLWREADLTGEDLIIDDCVGTTLIAMRLVPVEPTPDTREVRWPMCCSNDTGVFKQMLHRSIDDIFEWNERVPVDSCMRLLLYGAGNMDACRHATKVGTQRAQLIDYAQEGGSVNIDIANVKKHNEWGINSAQAMVDYSHERGWEIYLLVRHRAPGPRSGNMDFVSKFWIDHMEYEILDSEGRSVSGLSVAFPEVREHMSEYYAELAGFGADGVCVCYTRGCPAVLYEPPMVEGFKAEYGDDPRNLPESDERWLDFCAEVITKYMEQLKNAVGPGCKLSALVHGSRALNRRFGLDVSRWVSEGIVNDLFLMPHTYDEHDIHRDSAPEHMEYDFFQNLPNRERVRIWPMLTLWQNFENDPAGHCAALQSYLDAGADGYGFWDGVSWPEDKCANIWDLGKWPRPSYERKNRLVAKHEAISRAGYRYNKYSSHESG